MSFISLLVYLPLQLAFVPLAILGAVLVGYKQLVVSKRLGISQTAIEVINGRWTMHIFGLRRDPPTAALTAALPNTSTFGLWLALFPLWIKYKLSGSLFLYPRVPEPGSEAISDLIVARTLYFDRILERLMGDAGQLVLLGAGYDTRAYGSLRREGVAFFEVDQAVVQSHKRSSLAAAGIDPGDTRFVEVDFTRDDLFEKLALAGYDPTVTTVFLWEGVTLYLSEEAVRKNMQAVRDHAAPGSVLLADLYAERMIQMSKSKAVSQTLEMTGETLGFGLPFASEHETVLRDFVESESLTVGDTYFLGSDNDKGPFCVVVEMVL
jgi:methyltransferase (TIGR00027 family)